MANAPALTFASLKTSISRGDLAPVYLLHGEEGFFIDELVKEFEKVLPDEFKDFNQTVVYGPRIDAGEVPNLCRGLPMMSDRRVVILKEAQAMRADQLDRLAKYVSDPTPTTVFVIACRGDKAKGRKFLDAIKKSHAVVFESKKIPDYQMGTHIQAMVREAGLSIDAKALEMLKEYIGNDMSKIYNEVTKLTGILGRGAQITPEAVELHVGVSKEYNVFELIEALAVRDSVKCIRITDYFRANPKASPTVMTVAGIFGFFSDLLITYFEKDKSDAGLMRALGLKSQFQLKRFNAARQRYNAFQVIEIIRAIRRCDIQTKGRGSRQNEHQLLRELVFHILTAPGHLWS